MSTFTVTAADAKVVWKDGDLTGDEPIVDRARALVERGDEVGIAGIGNWPAALDRHLPALATVLDAAGDEATVSGGDDPPAADVDVPKDAVA